MLKQLLSLLLAVAPLPALAQQPANPRIVVPNPAGGTVDLLARLFARGLQSRGSPGAIVENRPGAAGMTGASAVARGPSDGSLLLMTNESAITILPSFRKETPYDPAALSAISLAVSMPFYMVVSSRLGVRDVKGFVALAKARGTPIFYGSTGIGGPSHLLTEQFAQQTGIELKHIPYQGGPQAMASLLAGETDLFFSVPSTALAQLKAPETAFLAVTSRARTGEAPDVPTFLEQGFPGYEVGSWFGLLGPPGMSADMRRRMRDILVASFEDPEAKTIVGKLGAAPVLDTPDEFAATIRADLARWRALSAQLKLTLD